MSAPVREDAITVIDATPFVGVPGPGVDHVAASTRRPGGRHRPSRTGTVAISRCGSRGSSMPICHAGWVGDQADQVTLADRQGSVSSSAASQRTARSTAGRALMLAGPRGRDFGLEGTGLVPLLPL